MKKASPVIALFISLALPALAEHGRLATTDRDPWIDQAANDLVISGMVADPGKDMDQMTNL